jgi:hypothetical protein
MALVGSVALVRYAVAGAEVWHERQVVTHIIDDVYIICAPDLDVYAEDLSVTNVDLQGLRVRAAVGGVPYGINAATVYPLPAWTVAQQAGIAQLASVEAAAERLARGIGAGAAVVVAPAVAGAGVAAGAVAGRRWVLAETVEGHAIGEQVAFPVGAAQDGEYGLMTLPGMRVPRPVLVKDIAIADLDVFCEERIGWARDSVAIAGNDLSVSEDVRTLSIKFAPDGTRSRTFRESVQEMTLVDFDDFPFAPRTTQAYVKEVCKMAECCHSQHLGWVQKSKIPDGDRAIFEDEILSQAIDLAVMYDGLCISNLACFELLIRRKQLIAEAHVHNPGAPNYEGADHWMGMGSRPGGAIVVSSLTQHVSSKMEAESRILKERRKAGENRVALHGQRGGGRGGRRGGGAGRGGEAPAAGQ